MIIKHEVNVSRMSVKSLSVHLEYLASPHPFRTWALFAVLYLIEVSSLKHKGCHMYRKRSPVATHFIVLMYAEEITIGKMMDGWNDKAGTRHILHDRLKHWSVLVSFGNLARTFIYSFRLQWVNEIRTNKTYIFIVFLTGAKKLHLREVNVIKGPARCWIVQFREAERLKEAVISLIFLSPSKGTKYFLWYHVSI